MSESSNHIKNEILNLLEDAYLARVNDLKTSIELGEKALALSLKINDKNLIGRSLTRLSLFHMIHGSHEEAMKMGEEAIKYFEELEDEKGVADAKYNIASVHYKTDNFHLGLVYLIDCITIYRKFNDYHNQARALKSLGTIYEYFGDEKNAIKSYEDAIEAANIVGDKNLKSNVYNPLSGIYLNQGKIDKALEMIEESISLKKQTDDVRGIAFAYYGRGKIYIKTGKFWEAEADLLKSLDIHMEMGERLGTGMSYYKLAVLYESSGKTEEAKKVLYTGLDFSVKYNIAIIKFKCSYSLYEIYKKEKNAEKALEFLENYLVQKESVINTQTLQIIENYEMILKMETLEKESKLQKEKAEIIEKKDRAEQAARVKQEFLSTMSHEIRTPLNAIITITTLLKEKSDSEDQQLIDSLKFASNNLLYLINDILDFTKLDTGKVVLENRPVVFRTLLENIRNIYIGLAKEKGLNLNLYMDENLAESYELDDTKISQILGNLISNAIKFTDQGTIDINIEKTKRTELYDTIKFSIKDTGIGIPESFINEIFESFTQPRSITTKKQGGSGLGLAIVKRLIHLHNSEVYIHTKEGEGTEFYFEIILKPSINPEALAATDKNQLKGKTVLLAEDNMINALVANKLLNKWGITADHAKNGIEAVEKSHKKIYDFVLMDIHMPEMNGYDATKQMRNANNPNKKTPIFALTADITAHHVEEYVPYFNGFLRKPIEIDQLFDALNGEI